MASATRATNGPVTFTPSPSRIKLSFPVQSKFCPGFAVGAVVQEKKSGRIGREIGLADADQCDHRSIYAKNNLSVGLVRSGIEQDHSTPCRTVWSAWIGLANMASNGHVRSNAVSDKLLG
ncbi:hypothetical protein PSTG_01357 [Puccinia striiformis f. sp. tritici PST-78]|uniref:Uncharacterized protein n=1 Tax=Puccinia striiformis f. sp. tritici PST-78 TaxID=1165861 RepID=A0A0L0W221_9BASI|nr:hypothetical protein PSTG_01357 [Puccinia striiformis f. sp. tritici PST-78]